MTARHLTDAEAQDLAVGLAPAPESERLEGHAAGCHACRAAVESYRLLSSALADLEVPAPPEDFTESVLARIEAREIETSRERRIAAAILAGVAAATAAAFALAGPGPWTSMVSSFAGTVAWGARAARACAALFPAGAVALLPPVAVGAALLALPLLLALSRLVPERGNEIA